MSKFLDRVSTYLASSESSEQVPGVTRRNLVFRATKLSAGVAGAAVLGKMGVKDAAANCSVQPTCSGTRFASRCGPYDIPDQYLSLRGAANCRFGPTFACATKLTYSGSSAFVRDWAYGDDVCNCYGRSSDVWYFTNAGCWIAGACTYSSRENHPATC